MDERRRARFRRSSTVHSHAQAVSGLPIAQFIERAHLLVAQADFHLVLLLV
jgi:hypothetical protein